MIRYDLRGFGRSTRPGQPFTRRADLLTLLDHFGIEAAVAVGHGGGGGTALGLAWFEIGDLERADPPGFARLGEIHIATAVLLGDLEYPTVSLASSAIAAKLDGCREVLAPGADHLLPLRYPAGLARVIRDLAG